MTKKQQIINQIKEFGDKYFNQDQKTIMIDIIENSPEEKAATYFDFIKYKCGTGFVFDYSPEVAKGRIITLREDQKRRINCDDEVNENENKLIIGDNYNALKSLLITHKNKINLIYIDPPYNTEAASSDGNGSYKSGKALKFNYKDKFGRGGWLNMMKTRLELAKELLSDEGVIFVSIDDKEQAYLKVLMDDIFGEDNFIANINWQSSFGGKNDSKLMPINTEYILFYGNQTKSLEKVKKLKQQEFSKKDFFSSKWGLYKTQQLCRASLTYYSKLDYIIYVEKNNDGGFSISDTKTSSTVGEILAGPNSMSPYDKKILRENRLSGIHNKNDWCYYWSFPVLQKAFYEGFVEIVKIKEHQYNIYQKEYEKAKFSGRNNKILERDGKTISLRNVISDPKISSRQGNKDILDIFNKAAFSYPKPVALIMELFSVRKKDSLILDFFAGSGTTGQAVMELNRKDGGNRKFILCTNNENNIAADVTFERLYRVINGRGTKGESDFKWLDKNKPYSEVKLRVINAEGFTNIALTEQNQNQLSDQIITDVKKGLQLLDPYYEANGLNLYYDLAALNPLENENSSKTPRAMLE